MAGLPPGFEFEDTQTSQNPVATQAAPTLPPGFEFEVESQQTSSPEDLTPSKDETTAQRISGLARSIGRGATYGLGERAEALMRSTGALPFLPGGPSGKSYGEELSNIRGGMSEYAKKHPLESTAAEIGGNIISPVSKIGLAAKGIGLGAKALINAAHGAAYTAGTSENPSLANVGTAAGISGAIGAIIPGGKKTVDAINEGIKNNPYGTLGQVSGSRMLQHAENFLKKSFLGQPLRDNEAKQLENMSAHVNELTKQGVQGMENFGNVLDSVAKKAKNGIVGKQSELYNNKVYKSIPDGHLAPASGSQTLQYANDISKELNQTQRDWIQKNVVDLINDPEGLNLAKLQSVKQTIGATKADSAGIKPEIFNRLYDSIKGDYYNSVKSAIPDPQKADVAIRNLGKADRFTSKYLKEGGVKDILSDYSNSSPIARTAIANDFIKSLTEKGGSKLVLNTFLRRIPKAEGQDQFKQTVIKNLTTGPHANFTKAWENMGDIQRKTLFGDHYNEYQQIYKNLKALKLPALNPSGAAAGMTDVALGGAGIGLAGLTGILPALGAGVGIYGASKLFANPRAAAAAMKYGLPGAQSSVKAGNVLTGQLNQ